MVLLINPTDESLLLFGETVENWNTIDPPMTMKIINESEWIEIDFCGSDHFEGGIWNSNRYEYLVSRRNKSSFRHVKYETSLIMVFYQKKRASACVPRFLLPLWRTYSKNAHLWPSVSWPIGIILCRRDGRILKTDGWIYGRRQLSFLVEWLLLFVWSLAQGVIV